MLVAKPENAYSIFILSFADVYKYTIPNESAYYFASL